MPTKATCTAPSDNVIRNAVNYSPEGSTILINIGQDHKHWIIDVTDNGPGVDEMQLPHIFTAFYRADSSANKPGTGLGLALTQHIIEQHCGKIIAENIKPNGLRMRFILPKKKPVPKQKKCELTIMPSELASDGIAQTVTPKQTHSGCISKNHAHTVRKGIYHVGTNRSRLLLHAQPHYPDRRERTSVQPGRTRTQQPAEYALSRKNHPVNPRHHTIAGLPAYTSLNKIPGNADLIIAVTLPDSYDTLFKTCRKKQLRHIILIQDWDSLSAAELHTAETAIRKHHGNGLNITACTTAGIQLPSLGLNISTQDGYAAGHTAILTGNAAVSRQIDNILNKLRQGTSRHISLHPGISPITSADWLNRFGHSLHTKTAVLHHNPEENQRKLFSAIRQFTRHTPLILHITCRTTETDRAVLHCLARHCNFLISFNADDLEAALRAQLSDLPPLSRLDILSDTPAEWLNAHAPKTLALHFPNLPHHIRNGHLTGTPTPSICHDIASRQLARPDTQAVLTILSPSGHEDYKKQHAPLSACPNRAPNPCSSAAPFQTA